MLEAPRTVAGALQSRPVAPTPPEMAPDRTPGMRTRRTSRKVNQPIHSPGLVAPVTPMAPRVMAKVARADAVVPRAAVVVVVVVESSHLMLTNAPTTRWQPLLQPARARARVPLSPTSRRLLQTSRPCLIMATKPPRLVPLNQYQSHPRNRLLHRVPLPSIQLLHSSLPPPKYPQGTAKLSLWGLNNRFRVTPASDNIHQVLTR